MKIYFCDVCNSSIPLQDIKENLATTIDGKIYCRQHNPLRAIEGLNIKKAPERVSTTMFGIVIVLLVIVIVLMVLDQSGPSEEYATLAGQNRVRDEITALQDRYDRHREDLAELKKKGQERDGLVSGIQTDIVQLRGDLGGVRVEIKHLADSLKTASDLRDRQESLVLKIEEFGNRVTDLEGSLETFGNRLGRYEAELTKLAEAGPVVGTSDRGGSSAEPSAPEESGESEELIALKKKLQSKDNSDRFEAVNQVYDQRIKEALPFLLPLLEDADQFVQVGAIQTVGELLYLPAIPILIEVLRDPDVTVREEALLQLIRMTGETSLNFDPRASSSEREKAVKKWEEWLEQNQ
jgi:hypothetical protein